MELMNELYALEANSLAGVPARVLREAHIDARAFRALHSARPLGHSRERRSGIPPPLARYDPDLAKEDLAEIPVQVNGKLRAHLHVELGTAREELERLAIQQEKIQPFLDGKNIVKVIVLPDRLVNLVVK